MSSTRTRKPGKDERVIVTDIDTLIAEANYAPHTFTLGGAERELPHLRTLTFAQLRDIDNGEVERVLTDVAPDVTPMLMDLPGFAFDAVIEGWIAHAGIDLGELLASAGS